MGVVFSIPLNSQTSDRFEIYFISKTVFNGTLLLGRALPHCPLTAGSGVVHFVFKVLSLMRLQM